MIFISACVFALLFTIVGTFWVLYLDKRDEEREKQAARDGHR